MEGVILKNGQECVGARERAPSAQCWNHAFLRCLCLLLPAQTRRGHSGRWNELHVQEAEESQCSQ